MRDLLTVPEVAKEKRAHVVTVRRWINRGIKVGKKIVKLASEKTGGRHKVNRSSLNVFCSKCKLS